MLLVRAEALEDRMVCVIEVFILVTKSNKGPFTAPKKAVDLVPDHSKQMIFVVVCCCSSIEGLALLGATYVPILA